MSKMLWLADTLRAAGLTVKEVDGWKERGRGDMGAVKGILCHHTGGPKKGDMPSLDLIVKGRPDLTGPLSQLVLGRSGTFAVVAAGRCNHAGEGAWGGVTTGNTSFIGIEAENAGTTDDPWPDVQMEAYIHGCAAIITKIGASMMMVAGHREYALPKGRKIDPLFDMDHFRRMVAQRMAGTEKWASPDKPPAISADPHMLKLGDGGQSVMDLQKALSLPQSGVFDAATEASVKAFQAAHKLVADGKVGPKTWSALA